MSKIDELRWVRVFTADHVSNYLIEQVRDRDYSVDDFYRYQQINLMRQTEEGIKLNPFNHLYVLVDNENIVKGFLWFSIDALTKDIFIQTYSVDKAFWEKGYAVKKLASHMKEILHKGGLNKIFWANKYPKHAERYGFRRSPMILMEYDPSHEKATKVNEEKGKDTVEKDCANEQESD